MQVGTARGPILYPFIYLFDRKKTSYTFSQWGIQERGLGGLGPPYFGPKCEKILGNRSPPPPTSLISRSGSGTASIEQMPPLSHIYNPGQRLLGYFPFLTCFCVEFAASQRYTFMNVNTALTRFLPYLP